jgi:hypothetical protein
MKATITKSGDFIREVEINRIQALEGSYHLEFSSLLLNAKDPTAVQKNFGLILKRDDLRILGNLINEALQDATI